MQFPSRMFGAVFLFAAAASLGAQAPASTAIIVRGITRDAESGAPIEGVRVEIAGAGTAISREAGRFDLKLRAPGTYAIRATRIGYQPVTVESSLRGTPDSTELVIVMTRSSVSLAAVVVTPGTFGIMQSGVAASQSFARDQIEAAPQIGEDIYRAVNRLPGIATDDFSSDFRVRGGAGSELYSTLDGVELVRPFHLQDIGGSFSIIDVKSIGAVDLTMGGLTADVGNRLTGAFAMRTIEPVSSGMQGSVGISLMNARAQAQGGFAEGRGGWLASYRRGYLDVALKLVGTGDSLTPRYDDALFKVHYDLPTDWFASGRVTAHALHAGDNLTYLDRGGDIKSRYVSDYLWLTWGGRVGHDALPEGDDRLVQQTVVSGTRTTQNRAGSQHDDRTLMGTVNDDRRFSALTFRQDWTLLQSTRAVLRWGGELSQEDATYQYANSVLRDSIGPRQSNGVKPRLAYLATSNIVTQPAGTRSGAYVTERVRPVQSLTLEAGLRYDAHTTANDGSFEPRLNVVWDVRPNTALRGAWGRMSQSQSLGSVHVEDGDASPFPAKHSEYAILGVDHMIDRDLLARVEIYRRKQSAMWPYGIGNADGEVNLLPELAWDHTRVTPADGYARGVEFLLRRQHGENLDWSASYALSEARELVAGQWIAGVGDQRHAGTIDLSWHPPDGSWRFTTTFTGHSGWPYTPTVVRVDTVSRTATTTTLGAYVASGTFNGATLPFYSRFDMRWMRFINTAHWHGSVFAELFNIFNADNPRGYYDSVRFDGRGGYTLRSVPNTAIPRLPAIGLSWDF